MLRVPLNPDATQTLAVVLNGQPCQIALRQNGGNMYFDLVVNGQPIVLSRICRNRQLLLADARYHGFVGDFAFWDTRGDEQPNYTELGSRFLLYYLDNTELARVLA